MTFLFVTFVIILVCASFMSFVMALGSRGFWYYLGLFVAVVCLVAAASLSVRIVRNNAPKHAAVSVGRPN